MTRPHLHPLRHTTTSLTPPPAYPDPAPPPNANWGVFLTHRYPSTHPRPNGRLSVPPPPSHTQTSATQPNKVSKKIKIKIIVTNFCTTNADGENGHRGGAEHGEVRTKAGTRMQTRTAAHSLSTRTRTRRRSRGRRSSHQPPPPPALQTAENGVTNGHPW